jgi:hypothetical protein
VKMAIFTICSLGKGLSKRNVFESYLDRLPLLIYNVPYTVAMCDSNRYRLFKHYVPYIVALCDSFMFPLLI